MEIHLPQSNTYVPQPFQLDPPKLCYQEVQKIQAEPKANTVPSEKTHIFKDDIHSFPIEFDTREKVKNLLGNLKVQKSLI